MGDCQDIGDVSVGMVVVVQGGLVVAAGGATGGEVAAGREKGVIDVGNVFGTVAIAVESVMIESGGHELHGAGGTGGGPHGGITALAGFQAMDGRQ